MAEITSINHHASLTTGFEFLGQGELVKVRTPCKLAKMRMRPGKAGRLGDRFLESAKFSVIRGKKPGLKGDNTTINTTTSGADCSNVGDCWRVTLRSNSSSPGASSRPYLQPH